MIRFIPLCVPECDLSEVRIVGGEREWLCSVDQGSPGKDAFLMFVGGATGV